MDATLRRRLAAEALGTALLVVFGPGSLVAALQIGDGSLDYGGLGMVALSFGLVVALVVYGFGATSGAHINPAVTLTLAVKGRFPWRDTGPYVLAQLLGSVIGALLVVLAFGRASVDISTAGAVAFGDGVGHPQAILVEALATFLLLLTIFALAVDTRGAVGWAGLMIGLSVTCLVLVFGPPTGAAVNPRALGPFVGAAISGGDVPWSQLPAYVIGSLLGGLAAAVSYDVIARPRDHEDAPGDDPQGAARDVLGRRT